MVYIAYCIVFTYVHILSYEVLILMYYRIKHPGISLTKVYHFLNVGHTRNTLLYREKIKFYHMTYF